MNCIRFHQSESTAQFWVAQRGGFGKQSREFSQAVLRVLFRATTTENAQRIQDIV